MNKKYSQIIAGALALVAITGAFVWLWLSIPKVGYVDNAKLFNEFKMKKILETEYKKTENMRKSQLDSLSLGIKLMSEQKLTPQEQQYLRMQQEQFAYKQQEFQEMNESLSAQYNEQIWNQLNQYVKDYGIKHQYKLIHGLTGDGALMYAEESIDITSGLIEYVNKRFEGENK